MSVQSLLREINAKRAAEVEPKPPISPRALAAVLRARAQFLALLEETFGKGKSHVHAHAHWTPLDPKYVPTYVCSVCGGNNVEHAFWVDPNTDIVGGEFGTWCYDDNVFCSDCSENNDIVAPEAFRKSLPRTMRRRYKNGVRLSDADLNKLAR